MCDRPWALDISIANLTPAPALIPMPPSPGLSRGPEQLKLMNHVGQTLLSTPLTLISKI